MTMVIEYLWMDGNLTSLFTATLDKLQKESGHITHYTAMLGKK